MARPRELWLWILAVGLVLVFGAIGFGAYSLNQVLHVVRDAYSAENASYAIAKFIDKHKRPPGSWEELDSSIRDACAETGYNYEDVIRNARIDFVLLNDRDAWDSDAKFISTETGAELGHPTPNGRILDRVRALTNESLGKK